MRTHHLLYNILLLLCITLHTNAQDVTFTPLEQQQVSIETPGLFEKSNSLRIDLTSYSAEDYSFPLPIGKAMLTKNNSVLEITTQKGDAVKAMFSGVVRLSRKHATMGNVIVIRHDNGLETVYADNAQNLVHVGDKVKAGQTIAIVGGIGQESFCAFSVMVNGRKLNPNTIIEMNSHRLRKIMLTCTKNQDGKLEIKSTKLDKNNAEFYNINPFAEKQSITLDLTTLPASSWAYPLPDAKVISPYGGKRNHSGVDLKTKPNDEILAAFDGVVTRSGPFAGYGNCIEIKHSWGLTTLYSHQSKNLVKVGDVVKAGQVIGLTGRTGRATTEHLHFEVLCQGRRHNPAVIFDHTNHALQKKVLTISKSGSIK